MPKNTTQCPRPGLEPRPLDPETSALSMRPPRLSHVMALRVVKFRNNWTRTFCGQYFFNSVISKLDRDVVINRNFLNYLLFCMGFWADSTFKYVNKHTMYPLCKYSSIQYDHGSSMVFYCACGTTSQHLLLHTTRSLSHWLALFKLQLKTIKKNFKI